MNKTVKVELRVPVALIERVSLLASLAGVTVNTVIKVAVASEILRLRSERAPPNQKAK